jgi:hypothetical protein
MVKPSPNPLAALYETDETAWLETTAALVRAGRLGEVDTGNLAEYLSDMAWRDRREVVSRLVVLFVHLLKWDFQSQRRCGAWQATILEQQRELRQLLESGTLLRHAQAVLPEAYAEARKQAAAETGLERQHFPAECPWSLESSLEERAV